MIWYVNPGQLAPVSTYGASGNAYFFRDDVEYSVQLQDLDGIKAKFAGRIKMMGDDYLRITGQKTGTVVGLTRTYVFTGKPVNVLKEDVDAVVAFLGT